MNGAALLLELLCEQGVDTIFGYPGGAVLPIYDALYFDTRIKHILVSHEQGAAHAADGYARATGRTGVCLATSGPGATNLVTGIACAYMDSVPLIALTGNVPFELIGSDSFQEVDIAGVTMPITKHSYVVRGVSELSDAVREAFYIAGSGRPGPVLIDISKSVQLASCTYEKPAERLIQASAPPQSGISSAAKLIRASKRPLIYAGGGVVSSDASVPLRELCGKTGLPAVSSIMGLTALPADEPLFLGFTGVHGHAEANAALAQCDLLIALGTRFSDRAARSKSAFSDNKHIIHVDIDPAEINKNIPGVTGITCDIKAFLSALTKELGGYKAVLPESAARAPLPAGAFHPREIIRCAASLMPDEAVIATDVGQHQMWTAQYYPFTRPRSFLTSGGLGAMGFGLGAAIGGCLGAGGAATVLFTGDASFHMNMGELAAAVTHELPIIIIVLNNGSLGMVRQMQRQQLEGRYSETMPRRRTDFAALALAFGAHGFRCHTIDELRLAVTAALELKTPCVIDCPVSPDETA